MTGPAAGDAAVVPESGAEADVAACVPGPAAGAGAAACPAAAFSAGPSARAAH